MTAGHADVRTERQEAIAIHDLASRLYDADHASWKPASWASTRPTYGDEPLEVKSVYIARATKELNQEAL